MLILFFVVVSSHTQTVGIDAEEWTALPHSEPKPIAEGNRHPRYLLVKLHEGSGGLPSGDGMQRHEYKAEMQRRTYKQQMQTLDLKLGLE